jgi:hypothetical protein
VRSALKYFPNDFLLRDAAGASLQDAAGASSRDAAGAAQGEN